MNRVTVVSEEGRYGRKQGLKQYHRRQSENAILALCSMIQRGVLWGQAPTKPPFQTGFVYR